MITTTLAVFAFITSALIGVSIQQHYLLLDDEGEATNLTESVAMGFGFVALWWTVAFSIAWPIHSLTGVAG